MLEQAKLMVEKMTGIGRPRRTDLAELVRPRKPRPFAFSMTARRRTTGVSRCCSIARRWPCRRPMTRPPCSRTFRRQRLAAVRRNGIYDSCISTLGTHEVLGIARGHAVAQFGGEQGQAIDLKAGDVVVLPAGTGHRRRSASPDLLVVGAYPAAANSISGGRARSPMPTPCGRSPAVGLPAKDPIYGDAGRCCTPGASDGRA